jgi:hypothetical protein
MWLVEPALSEHFEDVGSRIDLTDVRVSVPHHAAEAGEFLVGHLAPQQRAVRLSRHDARQP